MAVLDTIVEGALAPWRQSGIARLRRLLRGRHAMPEDRAQSTHRRDRGGLPARLFPSSRRARRCACGSTTAPDQEARLTPIVPLPALQRKSQEQIMTGFIKALILVPIGFVIILLAIANRTPIVISLDPFSAQAPLISFTAPLWLTLLVALCDRRDRRRRRGLAGPGQTSQAGAAVQARMRTACARKWNQRAKQPGPGRTEPR